MTIFAWGNLLTMPSSVYRRTSPSRCPKHHRPTCHRRSNKQPIAQTRFTALLFLSHSNSLFTTPHRLHEPLTKPAEAVCQGGHRIGQYRRGCDDLWPIPLWPAPRDRRLDLRLYHYRGALLWPSENVAATSGNVAILVYQTTTSGPLTICAAEAKIPVPQVSGGKSVGTLIMARLVAQPLTPYNHDG
jgi:hypothetical protein